MSAFEDIGVSPELIAAVEGLGWLLPTPIQAEAIPLILGGGDVMAAAETGSGKTGAFALPILQVVHESLRRQQRAASSASASSSGTPAAAVACVVSTEDRDGLLAVAPDGLRCQSRAEKSWAGARAAVGAFSGRVYYEATVEDEGLCRVGWSTLAASLDLGTDKLSFGYGGTGKKSHQRQFDTYGEEYTRGDVIGCLLDCEAGTIAFAKNGKDLGLAFNVPPNMRGQTLYPALCLKNAEVLINFGDQPLRFGPPPGYLAISKAGPQHTCSAAAAAAAAPASGGKNGGGQKPLCLILEPTRDLAEQTHSAIRDFGKHLKEPPIRGDVFVGGGDTAPQLRALRDGLEVVTGTPGRLLDFVESGKLALDAVRFFVLDEADRLIDNLDTIRKIFKRLSKGGVGVDRLQVLMFSATLHSPEVKALAQEICQNPTLVDLKGREYVPDTVDHVVVVVDPKQDRSWLQTTPQVQTDNCHALDRVGPEVDSRECWSEAVKRLKPRVLQRIIDSLNMEQCLIFCRTNFDCDNLEKFLLQLGGAAPGAKFRGKVESGKENPYSCCVLAGTRSMEERRAALQAFKDGDVRFLICTDVAARGIDIKELPYVVNLTLPDRPEDYIHRVGRVGRADTLGLAISVVAPVPEKVWYCSVKGYKPWLEPDAKNTKTNDQGGHTIWYNEMELLQSIEGRLGQPIARLGEDLSLPPHIKAKMGGEGGKYGQARGAVVTGEMSAHLQAIQQNVAELAQLEWRAQTSFLTMRNKWGGAKAGGKAKA